MIWKVFVQVVQRRFHCACTEDSFGCTDLTLLITFISSFVFIYNNGGTSVYILTLI